MVNVDAVNQVHGKKKNESICGAMTIHSIRIVPMLTYFGSSAHSLNQYDVRYYLQVLLINNQEVDTSHVKPRDPLLAHLRYRYGKVVWRLGQKKLMALTNLDR